MLHTHIHTRARSFNFIFGVLIIAAHFYVVRFLFDCFVFALILIYKSRHIFLHTPHIFVDRQSHTISCATSCIHTSTYFTVEANFSRSLFFPLCFAGFKLCFHNVFFLFYLTLFACSVRLSLTKSSLFHSKSFLMRKITQFLWKRSRTRTKWSKCRRMEKSWIKSVRQFILHERRWQRVFGWWWYVDADDRHQHVLNSFSFLSRSPPPRF